MWLLAEKLTGMVTVSIRRSWALLYLIRLSLCLILSSVSLL